MADPRRLREILGFGYGAPSPAMSALEPFHAGVDPAYMPQDVVTESPTEGPRGWVRSGLESLFGAIAPNERVASQAAEKVTNLSDFVNVPQEAFDIGKGIGDAVQGGDKLSLAMSLIPGKAAEGATKVAKELDIPAAVKEAQQRLRAYHGSNVPIEKLSHDLAQDRHGRQNALGWGKGKFYFSKDEPVARSYSLLRGAEKPIVNEADLAVSNPIQSKDYEELYKEVSGGRGLYEPYSYDYTDMDRDMYIERLDELVRSKGHDGIVDDVGQVAIFDPEQANFIRPEAPAPAADDLVPAVKAAQKGIKAYHGSPHGFEKFDISKIGTGEGAQAYGHGLYFAENEGIAKGYRDRLAGDNIDARNWWAPDGKENANMGVVRANAEAAMQDVNLHPDQRRQINKQIENAIEEGVPADQFLEAFDVQPQWRAGYEAAIPAYAGVHYRVNPGHMYEVNINADPDAFLDWDKPLSEQPESARSMLQQHVKDGAYNRAMSSQLQSERDRLFDLADNPGSAPLSSADVQLRSPEVAKQLRDAGIPGIKYLDAGSRTPIQSDDLSRQAADLDRQIANAQKQIADMPESFRGDYQAHIDQLTQERRAVQRKLEPSRNYVVFSDEIIDIVKKYGIAGALGAGLITQQMADQLEAQQGGGQT